MNYNNSNNNETSTTEKEFKKKKVKFIDDPIAIPNSKEQQQQQQQHEIRNVNVNVNNITSESEANIFSTLFYTWAQPLFQQATNRHKLNQGLEQEDLLPLIEEDLGRHIGPIFETAWEEQQRQIEQKRDQDQQQDDPKQDDHPQPTIVKALKPVIGKQFTIAGIIKVINTSLQFTFPLLLNMILKFIEETQNDEGEVAETGDVDPWHVTYKGYWLSLLLFLAMSIKAITENMYFHKVYRTGYQARVAVSVSVYNKALRLTSAERNKTTLGEMINLMQVDATKIELFLPQFHVLWDGMFQIIGYMTILYSLIGWPCFAGLVIMILAGPVQGVIMKKLFTFNRGMVKYTDERVKQTNEAIQGIRCVKMYTWEESFQNVISEERNSELVILKKMSYLRGASRAYMGALPGIVAVVSFIVYAVFYDGDINASTLFAALVAFGQLRFPLLFYPMALATYAQASVSAKRVEDFLSLKEVKNNKDIYNREDESLRTGEIYVKDVSIYWGDPNTPISDPSHHSNTTSNNNDNGNKIAPDDASVDNDVDSELSELRFHQPVLSDVNLNVVSGELLAVIGRVGCGKSTLSSAILNEAVIGNGSISLNGTIAYAAQSPWILNATLRDNIIFGETFDQQKYDMVIQGCQLMHDLSLLEHGDLTEIGENGINLSGGQRQRISIARAAYSEADIIVMDDPLSALDPEVGKKLFDECILNLMKGKTRILVTNQLQFLHFCDTVVLLDQGKVKEQGTFDDLSKSNGEIIKLLHDLEVTSGLGAGESGDNKSNSGGRTKEDSVIQNKSNEPEKKNENKGLVSKEERNVGAVSLQVYKKYIRAGGGSCIFSLTFFMFILCAANDLLNTLWITLWTSDAQYDKQPQEFYLGFYTLSCCTAGLFVFLRTFFLARFGIKASQELHKELLASILRAPMSFFDTTPTGRIISRFSKDLYAVDLEVTESMDFALFAGLTVFVALGTIIVVTPWFGVAAVPIIYIYVKVLNYFREVSRETKRLESISRSPVFAHFSETLGGIETISAYNQTSRFINDFECKVDSNTQGTYNNRAADRWLSARLELLGSFIAGLASIFACSVVINGTASVTAGNSKNFASVAGLSLNYAISITGLLNWTVRSFAIMEATMNAAERILFYTEEILQEAPGRCKDLNLLTQSTSSKVDDHNFFPSNLAIRAMGTAENLNPDWPSKGKITLKNLKMRYRPQNPLVLRGLNVEIEGGTRVGVVGRTGSGKSSLLLTLLRIVEPTLPDNGEYEAPITIDDIDILRIGLTDLRSAVGIIPQNPVLFSGTIRSNMDPFNEYTDKDIWNSLEGCGMKNTIEEMPALLEAPVAEYGNNLSQGQRQLLCLGRALLKHCRILLLDEATSSVDFETDKEIQRTLRKAFAGCTVLTIAHRVNTIMDSDQILVMVDGKASEFAPPEELLADKNSIFAEIVKHSGTE